MKLGNLSIDKIYVETTEIPKVYLGNTVVYEQSGPAPVLDYLRFIVKSDGVIYWKHESSMPTAIMPATTIEYSLDSGETWNSITSASGSSAPSFSVVSGDTVLFRGNNAQYAVDRNSDVSFSGTTCQFDVEGNIMSLVYGDNFSGETTLESAFTFHRLFQSCTGLTSAANLVLPATTLSDSCYRNMFRLCTSLVSAPTLPATQLEQRCYQYMYEACSSLNNIPSDYLPATVLSVSCYNGMFADCTSLTTAPELLAPTLVDSCYLQMFYRCTSLNYIKCLATYISAFNCTGQWVYNVSSTGTFVKASDEWVLGSTHGIPKNWTTIDILSCSPFAMTISATSGTYQITVSSLYNPWSATTNDNWLTINPSTGGTGNTTVTVTVSENTGQSNRTSDIHLTDGIADVTCQITQEVDRKNEYLTFVITNGGDINWRDYKQSATYTGKTIEYSINNGSWNSITSASGTATPTIGVSEGDVIRFRGNNSNYALDNSNYFTHFGGTTCQFDVEGNIMSLIYGDNFIGQTTITDNFVFACLFKNCSGLTSAENLILPATAVTASSYRAMFSNCSGLTSAPELPATTLADSCYKYMFENCIRLETAPELPGTAAQSCYSGMFSGCRSLTTAPSILPSPTTEKQCYEKMFSGCTVLETAPELPADVLVTSAYTGMFGGCTHLTYIKCLATDLSGASCTKNWVQYVPTGGTFVKASSADWSGLTGANGIPSGWNVEDAT